MSTEGFELSPFRNSARSYRLRPLGQVDLLFFLFFVIDFKDKKLILYLLLFFIKLFYKIFKN